MGWPRPNRLELTVAGLLLMLVTALAACDRERKPQNVIIVSVDTLNRAALRAFDSDAPELPALDEFIALINWNRIGDDDSHVQPPL